MARRARGKPEGQVWLAETSLPVFVLDAEGRLCAFNAGCEQLTGWQAEEVLGQTCRYASDSEEASPAALARSLCPPPDFSSTSAGSAVAPAFLAAKQGSAIPRLLHFFALPHSAGQPGGILGLATPIPSPLPPEISATRQVHAELAALRMRLRERYGVHSLVAGDPVMFRALDQLQLAQQSTCCVLLEGEPGTGREHWARHIHFGGSAQGQWFVPLDCRSLDPRDLAGVLERLHDLQHTRPTAARAPQPGTLYLADVDKLPRDLQEQVLRMQPRRTQSATASSPPLRLICSSARPLAAAAADGTVLPELFSLVSTLTIPLPPLRERGRDLPLLAQHFLEEVNQQGKKQLAGFDAAIWPLFHRYAWPGNLDELTAVIREAHPRAEGTHLAPVDLPFRFRTGLAAQESSPSANWPHTPLDQMLERVERQVILLALERSKYNKSRAAELLDINRARLYRRMEQLRIADHESPGEALEPPQDA